MKNVSLFAVIIYLMGISNLVSADTFGTGSNQFTIDFVPISGSTNPTTGYGIVNYDYRMGTYEITNDQWNKFQSAYGTVNGSPSSAYASTPYFTSINVPMNVVSWCQAAQFVNWLNTSTGNSAAYKFIGAQGTSDYRLSTWASSDSGYDSGNPFRNKNAKYFLPTENEWVKAAYWNGTNIQNYATKMNESLIMGDGVSGIGWNFCDNGLPPNPSGLWDVGSGSQELNGTYDMMGNVFEWTESPLNAGDYNIDSIRATRGGSYLDNTTNGYDAVASSFRGQTNPNIAYFGFGFRIASIPEPTTLSLLGLGLLALRRKK